MSVVRINAIEVPAERADMMAARFAARAGEVGKADGFEEFQLLRPTDERTTWLVYTRWRDEAAFQAWVDSSAFQQGHRQPQPTAPAEGAAPPAAGQPEGQPAGGPPPGHSGPVATGSALWSFGVEQRELAGS